MKKLLSVLLAAALLLLALPSGARVEALPVRDGFGTDISGFSAFDLYGSQVDGSVLNNADMTIINFWATWSGNCTSLLNYLSVLMQHYGSSYASVHLIGVVCESGDCNADTARSYLEEHGYSWANVMPDGVLSSVFSSIGYVPQTLIVDRNGIVRDHIVGGFDSYGALLSYIDRWYSLLSEHFGESCAVSFINGFSGEVFHTIQVEYGAVIAPMPNAPSVPHHSFTGWSPDEGILLTGFTEEFYIAMGDGSLTAEYAIDTYLVRFFDYNGTLLSTQSVEYGHAATAPQPPVHQGFVFIGWSEDFSCITEDLDVYAVYNTDGFPDTGILGDVNGDGRVNVTDVILIMRMSMNLLPVFNAHLADVSGDGSIGIVDAVLALRMSLLQ